MDRNASIGWLAVIVLVAAVVAWYGLRSREKEAMPGMDHMMSEEMGGMMNREGMPTQSHRSFMLTSDLGSNENVTSNQPISYSFSITDDQGSTLKDFQTVHEKIMHVIVVRKDLQDFQHVHPDFNQQTGQFTLANFTFPSDGAYRIFADFTSATSQLGPDGQPLGVTLHEDVNVGNPASYKLQPLVETNRVQNVESYQVQLAINPTPIIAQSPTMMSFGISRDGKPVTNLEKYLGALGHSVVLSESDLEFIHTHALSDDVTKQNGTIDFHVVFPEAGKYKIFTQFQQQGKVITTSYVVTVKPAW